MKTTGGRASAAAGTLVGADEGNPICDRCGSPFTRRKSETACASCRADRDAALLTLAREGCSLYSMARQVGCSVRWVRKLVHEAGIPTRPAACSPDRRALSAERRVQAVELYAQHHSAAKVALLLGVSETQVLNYLHDARVPTPRTAPPDEGRQAANEATRTAVRDRNRIAEELDLWTRDKVGDSLVLRLPSVVYLEREDLLRPVRRINVGGFTFPLYDPVEVKLFARLRRESDDHRVRMHRSPEAIRRWGRARGYSRSTVEELAARAAEREDAEKRIRTGIHSARERHARWATLLDSLQAERPDLDLEPKDLYGVVALHDWQTHEEDWPRARYPASPRDGRDFRDRAVSQRAYDRVRKALT